MTKSTLPISCRICKTTGDHPFYQFREMMYGTREVFDYFECKDCGCLQILEVPGDLSRFYPSEYYSLVALNDDRFRGGNAVLKKAIYRSSALNKGIWKYFFRIKEFECLRYVTVNPETRILDIGCGNGRNFLYPLAEIGFKNVLGADPYLKEAIRYPNGLKILKAGMGELDPGWDIITYHHVFEHLVNPISELEKIHTMLDQTGVCILRIPTVSSFAWQHYRGDWVQLDAPRHLYLHSVKSIKILASKTGFKLDKVVYDSTQFQFLGSENYKKDIPLNTPRPKGFFNKLKRKFAKMRFKQKAKGLNKTKQGDQAIFILRKAKKQ